MGKPEVVDLTRRRDKSFSSFSYIEEKFDGGFTPNRALLSLRRIFSQSRSLNGQTLIVENLPPVGAVADDNSELVKLYVDYENIGLQRLTFWDVKLTDADVDNLPPKALIGYAIVKRDVIPSRSLDRWHVFESVFRKSVFKHTYVPCSKTFEIAVGGVKRGKKLFVTGVMYCEQNAMSKACAQVAIRSLCASTTSDRPYYSEINEIARRYQQRHESEFENQPAFEPKRGLHPPQITAALKKYGYSCDDVDYEQTKGDDLPYHRYLYAGLESGAGALLGFKYGEDADAAEPKGKHVVPIFGHTFNRDGWVPRSEAAYFHIGEAKYIPSDAWLSSLVGHDDRFGSNYCLPRFYIAKSDVQYVSALIPPKIKYSGLLAEAFGVQTLNTLMPLLTTASPDSNLWAKRLVAYHQEQHVVLRAIPILIDDYIDHLQTMEDWDFRKEDQGTCSGIRKYIKQSEGIEYLWMVEVSLPELFPVNHRKLGEILLNAERDIPSDGDGEPPLLLARLAGTFYVPKKSESHVSPRSELKLTYHETVSRLRSHTPVYCTQDDENC